MASDEMGRQYFVAEAPAGRLGMLLVENDRGFVIVQGFGEIPAADEAASSEADKQRLSVLRQGVHTGDRLVAIDGEDVVHCGLGDVTTRLGKLSAKKRQLTFARYHSAWLSSKSYDPEKLVLARAPSGPLGLILSDVLSYGAFIEGFQQLPDGSESHLRRLQNVHRGCQIVTINGVSVAGLSREEVAEVLGELREQDKEILLYRTAPGTCASLLQLEIASEDASIIFDNTENHRCVVNAVNAPDGHGVSKGDVLVGVNGSDITCMGRVAVVELLDQAPFPRALSFYHPEVVLLPECKTLEIDAGPSGLNLDSSDLAHARITGFTTPADADRPTCNAVKDFIPGSYIIGINGLEVHQNTLEEISRLLLKLREAPKRIVVGNASLMKRLELTHTFVSITVPPGPLGIQFDGEHAEVARVSGFNPMADGKPGVIEQSRRIPVGSTLQSINKMNVTCLSLAQVVSLLQKLAPVHKELVFSTGNSRILHTVSIRVPPGPLGIDLKVTADGVVVDRMNEDPERGSTHIFCHGGVVSGSAILAIDGIDTRSLQIAELGQILRLLDSHDKVITFGTTPATYESMFSATCKPALKYVDISRSPMGIEFDSSLENAACVTKSDPSDGIPVGSRLVAIDSVDVQALAFQEIIGILRTLAGIQKKLTFDTGYHAAQAPLAASTPGSPVLKKILKGASGVDAISAPLQEMSSSPAAEASPPKSTVRFAGVDSSSESPASLIKPSSSRPPPLQIDPALPPPTPLAALSIRTLEATKAQIGVSGSKQEPALHTPQNQFMISMASWSGSRSSSRLVVDKANKCLHILPLNPSSPSSAKTSVIALDDISALDTGKASPPSPSKRGLLRSLSSKKDMTERFTVVISAAKTSKSSGKKTTKVWEFDMLSATERDELEGILLS